MSFANAKLTLRTFRKLNRWLGSVSVNAKLSKEHFGKEIGGLELA